MILIGKNVHSNNQLFPVSKNILTNISRFYQAPVAQSAERLIRNQ